MVPISVSQTIRSQIPGLRLGIIEADGIAVRPNSEVADREYQQLDAYITEKFSKAPPSTDKVVSNVRRMYRRIGWEPTQYRPSSEAMIRRFLKKNGLYRINNIVDLGNVVSTKFHLPMGLYDAAKIRGKVLFDVGREEESYQGISRDHIRAAGKLILRDTEGIFGNPTADSRRTSITDQTRSALVIFFTPPEVSSDYLTKTLSALEALLKEDCSACSVKSYQLVF
jgi:DNA/RNA-binding domain of Phe-tRNA-synthetase-like protein